MLFEGHMADSLFRDEEQERNTRAHADKRQNPLYCGVEQGKNTQAHAASRHHSLILQLKTEERQEESKRIIRCRNNERFQ